MKNDKPSIIVVLGIVLLLIASSYYFYEITSVRWSQPAKSTLNVSINTPFPPFEYKQGDKFTGFDIELAKKIGDKLDRQVIINDYSDFSSIFIAVEDGKADFAISGITITEDRDMVSDFSDPYYNTSQALLTLKKNNIKFSSENMSIQDFRGMSVGYQELTTSQTWVENNLNNEILKENTSFSDLNIGLQSLRLGGINGLILDESVANTLVRNYPDLTISGIIKTNEQYGIAVKEGDPQKLLPEINAVIKEMKENGEYDKLIKKYFNGD